jgi:hypothetical protein
MGSYGTALFQDDVAIDVREDFLDKLRQGHSAGESSAFIQSESTALISDSDDGPIFWLALAATQCEYGCLQDDVRRRALAVIDGGLDLSRWKGQLRERRTRALALLRQKLLGPQPKFRRPRRLKIAAPPPRQEALAPDGRGKAVASSLPQTEFMQVYLERQVGESHGGGSVFVAFCAFDDVQLDWQPGPSLCITYPYGTRVEQKADQYFFCGEVIPIIYRAS